MIRIGQASLGENNKVRGGVAGDSTGKEVYTKDYYVHSKGWRVLRAKNDKTADAIAVAMEKACKNDQIGYDQNQRNTLYDQIKDRDFDPSKASEKCETDCSALVRVCILYALRKYSIKNTIPDFITANQATILLKTGLFVEMTGDDYTSKSDYLQRGDILVTKSKGHTVVLLDNGLKFLDESIPKNYNLGDRILKNGSEGRDVQQLQMHLIELGYDCGKWGADGDFGDLTEEALKKLQNSIKYQKRDGIYDLEMHKKLMEETGGSELELTEKVKIVGGNCYIREKPDKSSNDLGVAIIDTEYECLDESETGWVKIKIGSGSTTGWVSGKYIKFIT